MPVFNYPVILQGVVGSMLEQKDEGPEISCFESQLHLYCETLGKFLYSLVLFFSSANEDYCYPMELLREFNEIMFGNCSAL